MSLGLPPFLRRPIVSAALLIGVAAMVVPSSAGAEPACQWSRSGAVVAPSVLYGDDRRPRDSDQVLRDAAAVCFAVGPVSMAMRRPDVEALLGPPGREVPAPGGGTATVHGLPGAPGAPLPYMVLVYTADALTAIQLTGRSVQLDIGIGPIRLGDPASALTDAFGVPESTAPSAKAGAVLHNYPPHLSFEVLDGRVYSMRVAR